MEKWDPPGRDAPLYTLTPPRLSTPPPVTETYHGFSRLPNELKAQIFRYVVQPEYFIFPVYGAGYEDRKKETQAYYYDYYGWAMPNPDPIALDTEFLGDMYWLLETRPRSYPSSWACILNGCLYWRMRHSSTLTTCVNVMQACRLARLVGLEVFKELLAKIGIGVDFRDNTEEEMLQSWPL